MSPPLPPVPRRALRSRQEPVQDERGRGHRGAGRCGVLRADLGRGAPCGVGLLRPRAGSAGAVASLGADARTGPRLAREVERMRAKRYEVAAHESLKSAPRGYPKDHPRVDLLLTRGLPSVTRRGRGRGACGPDRRSGDRARAAARAPSRDTARRRPGAAAGSRRSGSRFPWRAGCSSARRRMSR